MLLEKKGFPEESELVMCTVTKVFPHSIFVTVNEYNNRSGMIHISEVSPGRIRNIRDFVREGKVIVCKVLRIDAERGHIDLSLRRVNDNQKRIKINQLKQEQMAEKIVEMAASKLKVDVKKLYMEISEIILKQYDGIYPCFLSVVQDDVSLEELGIRKEIAQGLEEAIRQRIKKLEVTIEGVLTLQSFAGDGIEQIKSTILEAVQGQENVTITYFGAGNYGIIVKALNYKDAESVLKKVTTSIMEALKKKGGEADFKRKEK